MKNKPKKDKATKPTKKLYSILLILLAVVVLVSVSTLGYAYAYRDKVLLNNYLLGKNISGYDRSKLERFLSESDRDYSEKHIKAKYSDKTFEIDYKDFNWELKTEESVNQIIKKGKSGSFGKQVLELMQSLVKKDQNEIVYSFNELSLLDWISRINHDLGTPKEETNIIVKGDNVKITESKTGEKIDEDALKLAIVDRLALKVKGEINISLVKDESSISRQEAEKLVDKAKELAGNSVTIIGPNNKTELKSGDLGTMIELKKKLKKSGFLKTELGEAYVSFSSAKIHDFLQKKAVDLNVSAQDAKFSIADGRVNLTSASKDGREIKMEESVGEIIKALENKEKEIVLPTKIQEPSIKAQTAADIEKIGIREIIGSATTDFRKSPQNRVHNIQTGLKYISGAIIKPGEEFSTIKRLGKIDQTSGYLPELVIKENATVPEFGGGLCQVSTTLFRAAMNSGLKISERQNHSYRVSYYEPPVGMDATIYYPRPDFKFINTTDSYLLINGRVEGTKITFDIYGTRDGRSVQIAEPSVYDVTNPPEPIYTDDPTLEPGELKQTDSAHPGAKATFLYTVRKNGKVINEQKFNSAYVAWPAKYLRGPAAPAN